MVYEDSAPQGLSESLRSPSARSGAPWQGFCSHHFIQTLLASRWSANTNSVVSALLLLYVLVTMSSVETSRFLVAPPSVSGFRTRIPRWPSLPWSFCMIALSCAEKMDDAPRPCPPILSLLGNFICCNQFHVIFIVIVPQRVSILQ